MLRIYFSTGNLIISSRATLAALERAQRIESEQEVRLLLLRALTENSTALTSLRRFLTSTVTLRDGTPLGNRALIDLVAGMAVRGPLVALVIYNEARLDLRGFASRGRWIKPQGPSVPKPVTTGSTSIPAISDPKKTIHVGQLSLESRMAEMIERMLPKLSDSLRQSFGRAAQGERRSIVIAILALWAQSPHLGATAILDALLQGIYSANEREVVADAKELFNAIDQASTALNERDLDRAATLLAGFIQTRGVDAFSKAVAGGERRLSYYASDSAPAAPKRPPTPLQPVARRPQPATAPAPAPDAEPPPGQCLLDAAKGGASFLQTRN